MSIVFQLQIEQFHVVLLYRIGVLVFRIEPSQFVETVIIFTDYVRDKEWIRANCETNHSRLFQKLEDTHLFTHFFKINCVPAHEIMDFHGDLFDLIQKT